MQVYVFCLVKKAVLFFITCTFISGFVHVDFPFLLIYVNDAVFQTAIGTTDANSIQRVIDTLEAC